MLVDVVDYGGGNIGSVLRCLDRLSIPYELTANPSGDRPVLLPGVGAFGASMHHLNSRNMAERLREMIQWGTPYLGICIGLQILFEESDETPGVKGLGVLPGRIVKLKATDGALKIPQIGWNWVTAEPDKNSQGERDCWQDGYVYFVNSYVPSPQNPEAVLYRASYGQPFIAAVQQGNITAFQFHPEKSGLFGQAMIARWYRDAA